MPVPVPAEPEPVLVKTEQLESAPLAENPAPTEMIANGSNDTASYDQPQQDSTYGNEGKQEAQNNDYDMNQDQKFDYNNNSHQSAPHQHQDEEDYKPIGIKEDG